jgi:uncharacterized protein
MRCLLIAYLVVLLVMMFLEEHLIFVPTKSPGPERHPAGLNVEDAWFLAADGTRLHGWYAPHPNPHAVILFCHGNAGNVTDRDYAMRCLHDSVGASVLVFDYRGYGQSQGKPSEAGLLADARAARVWLAEREKIAEDQIVLLGESLGGGVAVDLAATDGARALVLESTFNSLPDLAAHYFPWLPVRWLMKTRFNSEAKIGSYQGPLFQSHGDRDTLIPIEFGQRLFAAANEPKQFMLIQYRDHNDARPREYYEALAKFFREQAGRE